MGEAFKKLIGEYCIVWFTNSEGKEFVGKGIVEEIDGSFVHLEDKLYGKIAINLKNVIKISAPRMLRSER
jgi:hypothetical protein